MQEQRELISRAARCLLAARYAIALTGAGISTESGIPDFRGPSGVWTKDPEAERRAYASYDRFVADPKGWWEDRFFGKSVLGEVASASPNAGHLALAELEQIGLLKCVITQNVDGLDEKAGTRRLIEYHGNIHKLRCMACDTRFAMEDYDMAKLLEEDMLPPKCTGCGGVVKTDGVMFGEPIPQKVALESDEETRKCDLMLICGTSAVVYPFAYLPHSARSSGKAITIVEINAEPTPLGSEGISDFLIQGKTGEVLPALVAEVKRLRK
ncbi:MAG: NAD-dependent deacylase [Desulfurivibrionaceae bacterium]